MVGGLTEQLGLDPRRLQRDAFELGLVERRPTAPVQLAQSRQDLFPGQARALELSGDGEHGSPSLALGDNVAHLRLRAVYSPRTAEELEQPRRRLGRRGLLGPAHERVCAPILTDTRRNDHVAAVAARVKAWAEQSGA